MQYAMNYNNHHKTINTCPMPRTRAELGAGLRFASHPIKT